MIIPEDLLSCCGFVGHKMADEATIWRGTAFYVSRPGEKSGVSFRYTVTVAHVIRNIIAKGVDHVLIRCNKKGGGVGHEETKTSDWLLHPHRDNCDVAVLIGVPDDQWDIKALSDTLIVPHVALSNDDITVGSDVFWTGLFTSHVGTTRNETLVRTGHIAALPSDGVLTRLGQMSAYLIDGVPLGGFSGSPVFSNHGTIKTVEGVVCTAKARAYGTHGAGENPTIDARLEALEKNITSIHERITQAQNEMDAEFQKAANALKHEEQLRQSEDNEIRKKLEATGTGGVHISAIGAAWLFVGVILSTAAIEIAELLK